MAKVLYRTVLKDAWSTTWRNKSLWLWGLFVALLGNAGEYQLVATASDRVGGLASDNTVTAGLANIPMSSQMLPGLWHAFTAEPFSTFMLLVVGLIAIGLAVFFVWLTMISIVALIRGVATIASGKKLPTIGESAAAANEYFAPVLVTFIFSRLVSWFLLTLLALLAALTVVDYYLGFPLFLVGFIVILPTLFIISFIVRYTFMFVVVRKEPVLDAIESALDIFRRHWLITLELGFILFIVNILVGLIMVALIGLLVAPVLIAAILAWKAALATWAVVLASFGILLLLVILFSFGSALGTFQWAAWTHLFVALKERGHSSKIVRVFSRFLTNRPVRLRA